MGLAIEINDEGGYWPGRDAEALRQNLEHINSPVAAAAGVLKDRTEELGGVPLEAPILAHPQFERLEAEGEARRYDAGLREALE